VHEGRFDRAAASDVPSEKGLRDLENFCKYLESSLSSEQIKLS